MHIIWPICVQIQITVLHQRINSISYIITSLKTAPRRQNDLILGSFGEIKLFQSKTQFAFKSKSSLNGA